MLTIATGCGDTSSDGSSALFSFGRTGVAPSEFSYPRAAVWSPDRTLYVVDKAGRVQRFNADGSFKLDWKMPEIAAGKPTGLGIDRRGRVYAADTHYARVMIFEPDGKPVGEFGSFGDGPGQFRLPTDVAVDADGDIYVGEYGGNDRISKFSPAHEFITCFPPRDADPLNRPQSLQFDRDGSLWVCDACNHRIVHFAADGRVLGAFGGVGDGPGEFRFPYNIDVLSDGTLVVCEYGNNRVQRLSRDGKSLGFWGRAGRESGQLAYPWALAVADDDRVFVIDSGNNRVQVFAGQKASSWRSAP